MWVGRQVGDPNSALAAAMEARTASLVGQYGLCPNSPTPAGMSPAAAAALAWRDMVQLPKPGLWMAPGKALTGMAGCLEIGGPSAMSRGFDVFGMPVSLSIGSTYDIDWGDGTSLTGVTSHGGPCPDGDLKHAYAKRGNVTITVTQNWTATWSAGGTGGTIAGVLRTVQTLALSVEEAQAVGR